MNSKDTAILDYAKYVENSTNTLNSILHYKGIDNSKNMKLLDQISSVSELEPKKIVSTKLDKMFDIIEEEFNNDPLRFKNGGEYRGCVYYIIRSIYDTTYLKNSYDKTVTSDGQEFTNTSDLTITWDKSKDTLQLEDGTKIRIIKQYSIDLPRVNMAHGDRCEEVSVTNSTKAYTSPLLFVIWDLTTDMPKASGTQITSNIFYQNNIRYIVFGENVSYAGETGGFTQTPDLIKIKFLAKAVSWGKSSSSTNITTTMCNYSSIKYIEGNIIDYNGVGATSMTLQNLDLTQASNSSVSFILAVGDNAVLPLSFVKYLGLYAKGTYHAKFDKPVILPRSLDTSVTLKFYITAPDFYLQDEWDNNITLSASNRGTNNITVDIPLSLGKVKEIFGQLKDHSTDGEIRTITLTKQLLPIDEDILNIASNKNWTVTFV